MSPRRGPGYRPVVIEKARTLRAAGHPHSYIVEKLHEEFEEEVKHLGLSTVKRWTRDDPPVPPAGPLWVFLDAAPDERLHIADYIHDRTRRGTYHPADVWPSAEVARWYVALSRLPDVKAYPWDVGHRVGMAHLMARVDDAERDSHLAERLAAIAAEKEAEDGR